MFRVRATALTPDISQLSRFESLLGVFCINSFPSFFSKIAKDNSRGLGVELRRGERSTPPESTVAGENGRNYNFTCIIRKKYTNHHICALVRCPA